jgi:chromosome segregation ATPase
VATNSAEINNIKERLATVEETENSHKNKIEAIEDEIITLQSDLNSTSNLINNNSTAIFNLDTNVKN